MTPVVARRAMSVFQLWPTLLDPLLNDLVVAFDGASRGPLPGPVQLVAQHIPDVSWVIGHTCHALDDFSHTRQRPQRVGVAMRFSTLDQRLLHRGHVLVSQLRFAPCTSG